MASINAGWKASDINISKCSIRSSQNYGKLELRKGYQPSKHHSKQLKKLWHCCCCCGHCPSNNPYTSANIRCIYTQHQSEEDIFKDGRRRQGLSHANNKSSNAAHPFSNTPNTPTPLTPDQTSNSRRVASPSKAPTRQTSASSLCPRLAVARHPALAALLVPTPVHLAEVTGRRHLRPPPLLCGGRMPARRQGLRRPG